MPSILLNTYLLPWSYRYSWTLCYTTTVSTFFLLNEFKCFVFFLLKWCSVLSLSINSRLSITVHLFWAVSHLTNYNIFLLWSTFMCILPVLSQASSSFKALVKALLVSVGLHLHVSDLKSYFPSSHFFFLSCSCLLSNSNEMRFSCDAIPHDAPQVWSLSL